MHQFTTYKSNLRKYRAAFLVLVVILLGVMYYLRDVSNTYYFVSLKTTDCAVDTSSSECKLSIVHLQTVTGDDVYFYYDKPILKIENKTGQLSAFTSDEKVQVTIVSSNRKEISKIRAVN